VRELVAAVERSVAMIRCPDIQTKGSGLVVSDCGHVATNNHVIADLGLVGGKLAVTPSQEIAVRIGGTTHHATLLTDPSDPRCVAYDYALLHLETSGATVPALCGSLDDVRRGDTVLCLGYPLDFTRVIATTGIVASLIRRPSHMNALHEMDTILTDALIQFGSSGGPMVHVASGRVIGLNTMGHSYPHVRQLDRWRTSPAAQQVPGMADLIGYVLHHSHSGLSYAIAMHHLEADPAFPGPGVG
jgi:S1-C subfamily serine protease